MVDDNVITFDHASARIGNATPVERLGMGLFRLGARLSSGFDFVGYSLGAKLVRSVLPSKRNVRIRYDDDCVFEYPYGDGYYGPLLDTRKTYNPPIETFLKSLAGIPYAFVDCGANFGYMSVMVTSKTFGNKPSFAIEADEGNFVHLTRNSQINGSRFECHHNAVFSRSGEEIDLYGAKHEAFTVDGEAGGVVRGRVTTLALDDVLEWVDRRGGLPVVLKLDIEGVEIEAMKGAGELLKRDCLIIYEEHGNDPDHAISRHFAEEMDMRLFHDESGGNSLKEFADLSVLSALKKNSRVGYDFFATNSPFWLEKIGAEPASGSATKTNKKTGKVN